MRVIRLSFRNIIVLVLLLTIYPIVALADDLPLQTGSTLYQQRFAHWTTFVIRFNTGLVARSTTMSDNGGDGLVISFYPNDCDRYTTELAIVAATANDKDINSGKTLPFAARVDEKGILTGHIVRAFGNFGEKDLHLMMKFEADSTQFLSDILNGSKLRFKFQVDSANNYYSRFSLNGSSQSIADARQWCVKLSQSQNTSRDNDSEFFEKNEKPTQKYNSNSSPPDERYF
jgi:hypothetical protein